ncbi:MAG TPA: DUF1569 domain-containing protein [Edaphobacter sp.]
MKSLASPKVLAETTERFRSLREEDRARWGRMTASQMVRHLIYAYETILGTRAVAPLTTRPSTVYRWMALWSGIRWPKNQSTAPELARAVEEECDAAFMELVRDVIEKTELFASGRPLGERHPLFGPMTARDWMRWGYLHADHHLRQFGR